MSGNFEYHINEFAVCSEFPLPYDAHQCSCVSPRDIITLRRASLVDLPSTLRKLRRQIVYDVGNGFLVEPNGLALHIDLNARVLTVDCPDDNLSAAAAWAFHAGLGAATVVRGGIPLHGAGLEIAGQYVALMADSGAGKSTLSWYLLQNGAHFGNDDLIPTYLTNAGAIAYPSVSMFPKLQREAVDRYSLNIAQLRPADYGTGEEEYYAPIMPEQRILAPAPLAAAFRLRPQPLTLPELVTVRRLPEAEAAHAFQFCLHTMWLIGKWVDRERIAALCRALSAAVPFYELFYPKAYVLLPELAATIYRTVESL